MTANRCPRDKGKLKVVPKTNPAEFQCKRCGVRWIKSHRSWCPVGFGVMKDD